MLAAPLLLLALAEPPPSVPLPPGSAAETTPVKPTPVPVTPAPAPVVQPAPAPAPAPEPMPAPAPEPAPAAPVAAPAEPTSDVIPAEPAETGELRGVLIDRELDDTPVPGARILVQCPCLEQPIETVSDDEGRFEVPSLPPGVYTVLAERGGRPTQRVVAIGGGQLARIELRIAPPTTTEELQRRDREEAQARTMLAAGGILEVGALALLIGAGAERAKADCKFGLEDCPSSPRPGVALGLGLVGGLFAAGGAALLGVGAHRLRRLRASVAVEDGALAVLVAGRF